MSARPTLALGHLGSQPYMLEADWHGLQLPKPPALAAHTTSALWHREHTSNSCRATSTERMQPSPFTVRTYC